MRTIIITIEPVSGEKPNRPCTEPSARVARIRGNVISSDELLGCDGRLMIRHASATYELRITRQGKLLLTKSY
ncbi:hemin uptake protein HemP [Elongatibacter sediminis]|uniref:Hemin uptake protein HemP n=1 Tax=Elongatibacter sediminis TaxID=3119006 RepID=A0AAW9R6H0_9GAMM